jgi:hypothetical protein
MQGGHHYSALKDIANYLASAVTQGMHYWHHIKPKTNLSIAPVPHTHADNYTVNQTGSTLPNRLIGYVDSAWASSSRKRNSLIGLILMFGSGDIGYKTKFQPVIAHSSTEAEFWQHVTLQK